MNLKEVTITIPYERRMKEIALMLAQVQLLEEYLKGEMVSLQSSAATVLKEQAQKAGEKSNG